MFTIIDLLENIRKSRDCIFNSEVLKFFIYLIDVDNKQLKSLMIIQVTGNTHCM